MVIIYMPAAYAPGAGHCRQPDLHRREPYKRRAHVDSNGRSIIPGTPSLSPRKRIAPVAFASQASRRHDGLALEVLGKFREIFRSAKLPGGGERPSGVTAAELWALA